jgi:antitoxin MazE
VRPGVRMPVDPERATVTSVVGEDLTPNGQRGDVRHLSILPVGFVGLRRRFGLDKPGAQVEIVVRDGEIVLVPHIAIPADQAWFWTKEWQAKEREVDEELASGQRRHVESGEEFVAFLDQMIEEGDEQA